MLRPQTLFSISMPNIPSDQTLLETVTQRFQLLSNLLTILERDPSKVSGTWIFRGTRVPVSALFENLKDGASIDQFLEWFPGVNRLQVEALLDYELLMLTEAANHLSEAA